MWNKHREQIPNIAGYWVTVQLLDGTELDTKVECVDGLHRLRGVHIACVALWRPRSNP